MRIPYTAEQAANIDAAITDEVIAKLGEKNKGYIKFPVDKKNGDKRWIHAPHYLVKNAQKTMLQNTPSPSVKQYDHEVITGFVPGMSILDNARPHVRKEVILSIDLKNFFPSVHPAEVSNTISALNRYSKKSNGLHKYALDMCTTSKGRLPQGAPTSPMLANWACVEGDKALVEFCNEHRLTYTRYADDLTFSSFSSIDQDVVDELIAIINGTPFGDRRWGLSPIFGRRIVAAPNKIKFMRRHKQQRVTGIVVNEKLSIPRARRRKLRAFMHDADTNGLKAALSRENRSVHEIFGEFSFLHLAHEKQAETYIQQFKELL